MPKFNPATVIVDMDGRPVRTGSIASDKRAVLATKRGEIAKAPADQQPLLNEQLQQEVEEAQDILTVGRAMIAALTGGMQGDDQLDGAKKLDFYEWAIKIKKADGLVEFDNGQMNAIKERVSKMYPSPMVVGQVFRAITPD